MDTSLISLTHTIDTSQVKDLLSKYRHCTPSTSLLLYYVHPLCTSFCFLTSAYAYCTNPSPSMGPYRPRREVAACARSGINFLGFGGTTDKLYCVIDCDDREADVHDAFAVRPTKMPTVAGFSGVPRLRVSPRLHHEDPAAVLSASKASSVSCARHVIT